jgi:hypothetical protein
MGLQYSSLNTPIMASHNNNQTTNTSSYEDFTCPICFRTMDADRYPILNLENCSCIETMDSSPDPRSPFENPVYSTQSYPSSGISSRGPDGPNNPDLNLTTTSTSSYLPLVPPIGLGEREHRYSSSEMSYQLQQFLQEEEEEEYEHMSVQMERESRNCTTRFLKQDVQLSNNGKGSKKSSMKSSKSGGSEGRRWIGYDEAEMMGLGGWDEGWNGGVGLGIMEGGYPMVVSGLTEFVRE